MNNPRAVARANRLAGKQVDLSFPYQVMLDHWFANGCRSRREAAIAAGHPASTAHYYFKKPEVIIEIERRRNLLRVECGITEERIKAEIAKIAFANLGDLLEIQADGSAYLDMAAMTDDQKSALAEYHVESYQELGDEEHPGHTIKKARIKFHDKKAALDSLARIMGMFKDKLEVNVGLTLTDKVHQARQRLQPQTIEGEIVP